MSDRHDWQTAEGLAGDTRMSGRSDGHHILIAHGHMNSRAADDAIALPDWHRLLDMAGIARISRYDARGHGTSIHDHDPDHYGWAEGGRDLAACARHLADAPTILIGASMGAGAILHAVQDQAFAATLSGIILAIPPTSGTDRDPMRPVLQRWAGILRDKGTADFVDYLYSLPPTPLFVRDYPEIRTHNKPHLQALDARSLAASLEGAAITNWPEDEKIRRINIPCLILCRDLDATHPIAMGQKLASMIPQSTLHISHDCEDIRRWPDVVTAWIGHGSGIYHAAESD